VRCVVDDDELVRMKRVALQRLEKQPVVFQLVVHRGDNGEFFHRFLPFDIQGRPMLFGKAIREDRFFGVRHRISFVNK